MRRAYADWANQLFGSHQEDLAMNGVDLIQVARVGIQNKNAADIRMAVDAVETLLDVRLPDGDVLNARMACCRSESLMRCCAGDEGFRGPSESPCGGGRLQAASCCVG